MNVEPRVNECILDSIPLNKKLKRYFLSKYRILAKHNGLQHAASVFADLRVVMLEYRADPDRSNKRSTYIDKCPVRKNGWLSMLFDYSDSQPEYVLNFLKLYVGLNEPLVSVEQSANQQHVALQHVSSDTNIPSFLRRWVEMLKAPQLSYRKYQQLREGVSRVINGVSSGFAATHTYDDYSAYFRRWRRIMKISPLDDLAVHESIVSKEPLPEMYKDFIDGNSMSLEADLIDFLNMLLYSDGGGQDEDLALSPQSLYFVYSKLNPDLIHLLDEYQSGSIELSEKPSFLSGLYVGHVHHIPKKGTVKRRPIAVPNRFLQMGLAPIYSLLSKLVFKFPKDATYNQDKFDKAICNRVSNPNLYIGSVDLSQATDNLPFSWGEYVIEELLISGQHPDVIASWDLFREMSKSMWYNDGIMSKWTVGQPLGSLPSFMTLSITHNIFLESLAWDCGYVHSPYAVLGDDVVIFTKKLRNKYISEMKKRRIPLSLHKSFKGNLTEFAGKTYIRNHVPFYTPDQSAITFTNLFDFQKASGILLPWNNLPRCTRRRFSRSVFRDVPNAGDSFVRNVYNLIQKAEVHRASRHFDYEAESDLLELYFFNSFRDGDLPPEPDLSSGIVLVHGRPITYLNYGYAEKHGHKLRYRRVELPKWYKDKFRPSTTDALIQNAIFALKTQKGHLLV